MDKLATKIGIAYDKSFLLHEPGPWHPETPDRLKVVMETVKSLNIQYDMIEPREASADELMLVHDPTYVEAILNLDPKGTIMLDPDTAFSPGTKTAALKAVGAVLARALRARGRRCRASRKRHAWGAARRQR